MTTRNFDLFPNDGDPGKPKKGQKKGPAGQGPKRDDNAPFSKWEHGENSESGAPDGVEAGPGAEEIYEPEATPYEQMERDILKQSREEMVDDAEHEFDRAFKDMTLKMMWDILLVLINPTPEATRKILTGVCVAACNEICATYNQDADKRTPEEAKDLEGILNEAAERASARFIESFSSSVLTDEFSKNVLNAISMGVEHARKKKGK